MKTRDEVYSAMKKKFNDAEWVDDIMMFDNNLGYDYASAFIGVTEDRRAVYDYNLMVQHIIDSGDLDDEKTDEEKATAAADWIGTNTFGVLYGNTCPIVISINPEEGAADMLDEREDLNPEQILPGMEDALVGIGENCEVVYYYDKIPDMIKNHEFASNLILMHEVK